MEHLLTHPVTPLVIAAFVIGLLALILENLRK